MTMNSQWDDEALSQVFNAVSVGIMILNEEGRITAVNQALLAYFQIKEDQLEKKKDFYFRMFDDFSALIWRTDALGKVIYVNKEWTNFIGVSRAECLGAQYLDWIHPKDRDSYMAIRKKAYEMLSPFSVEYRILHRSGRYCWIKGIYSPSSEMDGEQGYTVLGINITERKELEKVKSGSLSQRQPLI
jgi:PAS domain S-box-containing protein